MSRRRTSLVEDIFDLLQQLPWWAGVLAAGLFWLVGHMLFGVPSEDETRNLLNPIARVIFNGLAVLSLFAALISAIKSVSRRKLLDRQSDLEALRGLSWKEFEQLVGEAYRRTGYDVEETGGGGADGGIDLVLRGRGETVLVQCKQWKARQVGVDKVRELYGVVMAEKADGGVLVSSGHFTKEAKAFAAGKPMELVDGPTLHELVRSVQDSVPSRLSQSPKSPVSPVASPVCPLCGSPMVLRTARRGVNAGRQFYGCSRYPACRGTQQNSGV